jgi:hypothetical protein
VTSVRCGGRSEGSGKSRLRARAQELAGQIHPITDDDNDHCRSDRSDVAKAARGLDCRPSWIYSGAGAAANRSQIGS